MSDAVADRYLAGERAEDRVVLEQVPERAGVRDVVDGDDLDVRVRLVRRAEDVAADAAEAVDADAYSHDPDPFPDGETGGEATERAAAPAGLGSCAGGALTGGERQRTALVNHGGLPGLDAEFAQREHVGGRLAGVAHGPVVDAQVAPRLDQPVALVRLVGVDDLRVVGEHGGVQRRGRGDPLGLAVRLAVGDPRRRHGAGDELDRAHAGPVRGRGRWPSHGR